MEYQGHKNWNHWNVALYLHNERDLYTLMRNSVEHLRNKDVAAAEMVKRLPSHTPDGAPYTFTSVRAALVGE